MGRTPSCTQYLPGTVAADAESGQVEQSQPPLLFTHDSRGWLWKSEEVMTEVARQGGTALLQIFRAAVPVLVVCAYAGCPLAVSWAKVVDFEVGPQGQVPIKGRPFKEASVIVASWTLVGITGLLLCACLGGRSTVYRCFDLRAAFTIAPAGTGWALADVCEVLAVSRIDPATYGVISQARLLGSASACRLLRGLRQSQVQWGILCALSLICAAYCLVPDDVVARNHERLLKWRVSRLQVKVNWYPHIPRARHDDAQEDSPFNGYAAGAALALGKVALSVLSGVYGECCFKKPAPVGGARPEGSAAATELHVQMTQASLSSVLAAYGGYLLICFLQDEPIGEFFSGPDGVWDTRTMLVALLYCFREWICNLCVKQYDSLVKNICNAIALVVTYVFAVLVTGDATFSPLRVLLLLAAVVEVVNYAATRRQGGTAGTAADAKALTAHRSPAMTDDTSVIPVTQYSAITAGKLGAHAGSCFLRPVPTRNNKNKL